MSPAPIPSSPPAIALTLMGAGEALLRLEKRVRCASRAVGVPVDISIAGAELASALGLGETPAIARDGCVVLRGLPRTEEIEICLRTIASAAPQSADPGA